MNVFKKMLCGHDWKQHAIKQYQWQEKIQGTWDRLNTVIETHEVLLCKKCGKIKKIKY